MLRVQLRLTDGPMEMEKKDRKSYVVNCASMAVVNGKMLMST